MMCKESAAARAFNQPAPFQERQSCGLVKRECRGSRFQLFIGSRLPLPFGVVIVVQVPLGTYFQALAW